MTEITQISGLNLYGRMIYGIECLIWLWNTMEINADKNIITSILEQFCSYTDTQDLSSWDSTLSAILPETIFEAINKDGVSLCPNCPRLKLNGELCINIKNCIEIKKNKTEQELKLYSFYCRLDIDFLNCIDYLYWVGAGELYGMPTDLKESEFYINKIIEIMKKHNCRIPKLESYQCFRFNYTKNDIKNEKDVWGERTNCTYLLSFLKQ